MRKIITLSVIAAVALPLAACGPIPLSRAEELCYDRARLAQQPRGRVGLGVDSNGNTLGGLELNVSSDFIAGRDPIAVYNACVYQRSGQTPSRQPSDFPGWRG